MGEPDGMIMRAGSRIEQLRAEASGISMGAFSFSLVGGVRAAPPSACRPRSDERGPYDTTACLRMMAPAGINSRRRQSPLFVKEWERKFNHRGDRSFVPRVRKRERCIGQKKAAVSERALRLVYGEEKYRPRICHGIDICRARTSNTVAGSRGSIIFRCVEGKSSPIARRPSAKIQMDFLGHRETREWTLIIWHGWMKLP